MATATYFIVYTGTPSDSAATGCSPTDRTRRPNVVFHNTKKLIGTSSRAMIVSHDTSAVTPFSIPAASETMNQCFADSQPNKSGLCQPKILPPATMGTVAVGMLPVTVGDCVALPPLPSG